MRGAVVFYPLATCHVSRGFCDRSKFTHTGHKVRDAIERRETASRLSIIPENHTIQSART